MVSFFFRLSFQSDVAKKVGRVSCIRCKLGQRSVTAKREDLGGREAKGNEKGCVKGGQFSVMRGRWGGRGGGGGDRCK
jgi:hypothetical protein